MKEWTITYNYTDYTDTFIGTKEEAKAFALVRVQKDIEGACKSYPQLASKFENRTVESFIKKIA